MISKTLKLSVLVIAICSISFIDAQERQRKHRPSPEELFQKLDTNDDGALSLEEFKSKTQRHEIKAEVIEERFKTLDANTDNALSLEEFKQGRELAKEDRLKKHFSFMDKDGDGVIDFEEFKAFNDSKKTKENTNVQKIKNNFNRKTSNKLEVFLFNKVTLNLILCAIFRKK